MSTLNRVIVIGRLGRDPELKYTNSGQAYCHLSVATDESYKDAQGQKVDQAEWHRVVVWRKQAEFAGQYLSKGRLVLAEGKLQTRKWTDKAGVDRYTTEIIARQIQALDRKNDGSAIPAPSDQDAPPEWETSTDPLPF